MRTVFAAMGTVAMVSAVAAAQDRQPVWSGGSDESYGWASDCTDCVENEYVLLGCERGAGEVRAELIGLITPEGAGEPIAVVLDVDGEAEEREADVVLSEMFGSVPVLTLRAGDPLFDRLGAGQVLTLSVEGDRLEIPLAGARGALDAMFSACR